MKGMITMKYNKLFEHLKNELLEVTLNVEEYEYFLNNPCNKYQLNMLIEGMKLYSNEDATLQDYCKYYNDNDDVVMFTYKDKDLIQDIEDFNKENELQFKYHMFED